MSKSAVEARRIGTVTIIDGNGSRFKKGDTMALYEDIGGVMFCVDASDPWSPCEHELSDLASNGISLSIQNTRLVR